MPKPFRNDRVHIMADMCSTCIFRAGNLMDLEPGRVKEMVATATRKNSAIICHETLDGGQACCAGFYTLHATQTLQLAVRLGMAEWVKNA